ncbi:MAG: hypothetical protein IPM77_10605 [Crocinitomicaceae bacterium]|nr:hypothetical protein [Crocinitomicaceae bacterium]
MNRIIFLFFLLPFKLFAAHPDMNEIRDLFSRASTDESANTELFNITKSYSLTTFPVYHAYNAAAEMTLANHVYWPASKLEYFNAGKERLEKVIKAFPENVEIRYIRYCVQQGAPFFLGYSSDLQDDKNFVLKNINRTDWSDSYKKSVKEFLN